MVNQEKNLQVPLDDFVFAYACFDCDNNLWGDKVQTKTNYGWEKHLKEQLKKKVCENFSFFKSLQKQNFKEKPLVCD